MIIKKFVLSGRCCRCSCRFSLKKIKSIFHMRMSEKKKYRMISHIYHEKRKKGGKLNERRSSNNNKNCCFSEVFVIAICLCALFCCWYFQYYNMCIVYSAMCIFLAKYLFWHCCCASWAVQSALALSASIECFFFSCSSPHLPFPFSLILSLSIMLSLRECVCV